MKTSNKALGNIVQRFRSMLKETEDFIRVNSQKINELKQQTEQAEADNKLALGIQSKLREIAGE